MYEQISPDTSHIRYEETDLSYLKLRPYRFKCGIYLICIQGKSIISTGVQQYAFDEQTELIFLTGSLIQIIQASADFKVRILLFPKDVFLKAILPIDTPYFNYVHEHPHYHHTADERSQIRGGKLYYGWTLPKCFSRTTTHSCSENNKNLISFKAY